MRLTKEREQEIRKQLENRYGWPQDLLAELDAVRKELKSHEIMESFDKAAMVEAFPSAKRLLDEINQLREELKQIKDEYKRFREIALVDEADLE